jgi:geranylgeranyl diphosphate synthase type II
MLHHAIYGAVIVVLIVVLVFVIVRSARTSAAVARLRQIAPLGVAPRSLRALSARAALAPRTFAAYQCEVDALVAAAAPEFGAPDSTLAAAAALALRGGKRLRSAILLEIARRGSELRRLVDAEWTPVDAAECALSIEYAHAASLVLDDLPCFDNDSVRRGAPSVHAAYGPAVAQMAATSLMMASLQCVCRQADWIDKKCPAFGDANRMAAQIVSEMAQAFGPAGAAGGQLLDVAPARQGPSYPEGALEGAQDGAQEGTQEGALEGTPASTPASTLEGAPAGTQEGTPASTLEGTQEGAPSCAQAGHSADAVGSASGALDVARRKTASFFEVAFATGWLAGGGAAAQVADARAAGTHFGLALQIADDLVDEQADAAQGRPGQNYAHYVGRDAAAQEMHRCLLECRAGLERLNLCTGSARSVWGEFFAVVTDMAQKEQ